MGECGVGVANVDVTKALAFEVGDWYCESDPKKETPLLSTQRPVLSGFGLLLAPAAS